jgi:hypothetical protein
MGIAHPGGHGKPCKEFKNGIKASQQVPFKSFAFGPASPGGLLRNPLGQNFIFKPLL